MNSWEGGRMRWLLAVLALVGALLVVAVMLGSRTPIAKATISPVTTTFNFGAVTINDFNGTSGAATPYPATLNVTGLAGRISKVTLTFNNLTHGSPADLDILLVGPGLGGRKVLVMSDVGGNAAVNNVSFTFDDAAPGVMGGTIASGSTYKPSDAVGSPDTFEPPAPVAPYAGALADFNDQDPNGFWYLFVIDSVTGSAGSIGGVDLAITTQVSDLAVTAYTVAPNPALIGTNFTLNVTAANLGPDPATNVVLTTTIPTGATVGFVSQNVPAGWTCNIVGGNLICNKAAFAVGSEVLSFTFLLDANTPNNATLTSVATIGIPAGDPNLANNSQTISFQAVLSADLEITSYTGTPNPATAGGNVTFNLRASQLGVSPASSVVITIPLPANTTFVSATAPGGWACTTPAVGGMGNIVCTLANWAATGVADFQYTVTVDAGATGSLVSTAVIGATTPDPVPVNNSRTATVLLGTAAELSLTGSVAPNPVSAGGSLTYNFTVSNNGPSAAANVAFATTTPANTTFGTITAPAGWNCTTPAVGGTGAISCTAANQAVPGTANFVLVLNVNAGAPDGSLSLTANVSAATPDQNPANNTLTLTTIVGAAADLQVVVTDAPDPVLPGQQLTYRVVLTNAGPSQAVNARFTLTIPAFTTFVSFSGLPGWNCTPPAVGGGGTLSCTIANFGVGSQTTQIVVLVNSTLKIERTLTSEVSISATTLDQNPTNNALTVRTALFVSLEPQEEADIIARLRLNPDRTARPDAGTLLTYSFSVTNVGMGNARGVTVRFPIAPGTEVGFAQFLNPRAWVTAVLTNEVVIALPELKRDDVITGTLVFRPTPVARLGDSLLVRYKVTYTDPARVFNERISNGVSFVWAEGTLNQTGSDVQPLGVLLKDKETLVTINSRFFIPEEKVTLWLTTAEGKSIELAVNYRADGQGDLTYVFDIGKVGLAPGTYSVSAYGHRSLVTGTGSFKVEQKEGEMSR
jgi:uncharacterized repeat protein (TIGR01451 family)